MKRCALKKKSADSLFNSGRSVAERYKTINFALEKAGTDIVEIGVPFPIRRPTDRLFRKLLSAP